MTDPKLLSYIRTVELKRRPLLPSSGINVIPLPLGLSRWRNGVFLFHEKLSVPQVICVILIVVGIAGLKILAKE